jgi:hypothetical protein
MIDGIFTKKVRTFRSALQSKELLNNFKKTPQTMRKLTALLVFLTFSTYLFCQSIRYHCIEDFDVCSLENLAVTLDKIKFTPSVIRYDATTTVLLEAFAQGSPSRLALNVGGILSDLNDAGINGDKVAGDNIFTLRYPIKAIATALSPSDAYRRFVGFMEVYEGGIKTSQYNVFAQVRTAEMPNVTTTTKDVGVQATEVLVNIVANNSKTIDYTAIAKRFYLYYDNRFDFLNFIHSPGYVGNRFHATVSTSVGGTGLTPVDNSTFYGSSNGKLKGFNAFPVPNFYDPVNTGFIHEFGHQWINFSNDAPLADGIPHWPYSNIGYGVMGISIGGRGGAGGSFSKIFTAAAGGYNLTSVVSNETPKFNDWELYYMGLISKSEIKSNAVVFKDQITIPGNGFFANSAFTEYSIDNLIAKFGNRTPSSAVSQKKFKVATIIVSDSLLTPDEIAYFHFMTLRAESKVQLPSRDGLINPIGNPFFLATGGRGSLDVQLSSPTVGIKNLYQDLSISAYPNPFQTNLALALQVNESDEVQLNIWDMLGRRIWSDTYGLQSGDNLLNINTEHFPSGAYHVVISGSKYFGSAKVVK